MAARRLLIVMVVLLAISTLAAALVPPPPQTTETTTTSRPTATERTRPAGGELVRAEVEIGPASSAPKHIDLEPGDQLALVITSARPGEASVPDLGLIEFAGPGNPARFDILVDKPDRHPVEFQGAGTIATIAVERPGRPAGGEPERRRARARSANR